jgi:1-phosphofructokinase
MILSFTPNPAVDKTLQVRPLHVGEVNRSVGSDLDPGGKGINVSRVAHRLGASTVAVGVLGGHIGSLLQRALHEEGVPFEFVWIDEETRLNVILHDQETGAGTRVWDRGPIADSTCVERITDVIERRLESASVFVTTGSLLRGMPADFHAQWIARARALGVKTILDADGPGLEEGLPARPDLIKPNVKEAEGLLGRALPTEADVVDAALELCARGAGAVVISRGGEGSILATAGRAFRAIPPQIDLHSTVGSGDSMVAGLAIALARGDPLQEGLRVGTAAGAATATTVGTSLASAAEVRTLVPDVRLDEIRVT